MRVAIVTESFLPHMNGVTRSVSEITAHLHRRGHEALIVAPRSAGMPAEHHEAPVVSVPSVPMPGYPSVRVGTTSVQGLARTLERFGPDLVHLASPFALGWTGANAARRSAVPVVAAYQTDVAAYAQRYRLSLTTTAAEAHVARLHRRSTLTLVPSSESERQLRGLGVDRLRRWGRGVDTARFGPEHRSESWRRSVAGDEVIVGYVGRLAAEKQVEDLRVLADLPGVRLVIVGDGPLRAALMSVMPTAVFLGHLDGPSLATAIASLDIFVHPGESETFGQTLQEAHASGLPVVATGRGGPLDLIRSSVDGWLYRPGDLGDLRSRVLDLVGDERKRRAFGVAGREAVAGRTWERVCDGLLEHYDEALTLAPVDARARGRRSVRPESAPVAKTAPRVRRYVALGDSLTEGLCDPGPAGELRGWADRLAHLVAGETGVDYANLAVRSKRTAELCAEQLPVALALRPDLATILIGANDLVRARVDIPAIVRQVEGAVAALRASGAQVILVTPFLPARAEAWILTRRFARFATALVGVAARHGATLVDTDLITTLGERDCWGEDLVHLSSAGHRRLAYQVGSILGVPDADTLSLLDADLHRQDPATLTRRAWWTAHALPWVWRRLHGRRAGDGRSAKHATLIRIGPADRQRVDS